MWSVVEKWKKSCDRLKEVTSLENYADDCGFGSFCWATLLLLKENEEGVERFSLEIVNQLLGDPSLVSANI